MKTNAYVPRKGDVVHVRATVVVDGFTDVGNVKVEMDREGMLHGRGRCIEFVGPTSIIKVEERPIAVGDRVLMYPKSKYTVEVRAIDNGMAMCKYDDGSYGCKPVEDLTRC